MAVAPGIRRRASHALPFDLDRRMLLGFLLVVLSVVGGLLFWRGATDTTSVLVAVREIPPGHVIQRDDLRIAEVRLEGDLAALALTKADSGSTLGRTTGTTIHAGEMLVRPDLATGPALGADEAAVTLPVAADAIYPGIRPTDEVTVLSTANAGRPEAATATLVERATILAVGLERQVVRTGSSNSPNDGATVANITIAVPRSEAEAVAHAIVTTTITFALLAPQESSVSP